MCESLGLLCSDLLRDSRPPLFCPFCKSSNGLLELNDRNRIPKDLGALQMVLSVFPVGVGVNH